MNSLSSAFLLLLLLPQSTAASDISGESRTYLLTRETADSERLIPLYEYLDFDIQNLGAESISFHAGGWLRESLNGEEINDKKTNGDLQYAYLSLRNKKSNAILKLGRVLIFEGVAAEQVDGIYVSTGLRGGFGISAFGGVPVETDFDKRGDDSIYGGRISHGISEVYMAGVSYLKEKNYGSDFREEEGIDLWIRPIKKLEILGKSNYNGLTDGWMEHSYYLILGPFNKLRLSSEVSKIDYNDYFQSVTSGVFKLVPGIIDPNEKVLIAGGEAAYSLNAEFTVSVNYKNYNYDRAGSADSFGGGITYSLPDSWGTGISYRRMEGESETLKYNEYRAYIHKIFGKADITLDFFDVTYDKEINGVGNAYSASLAAGYNFSGTARIAADLEYSHNPNFDEDVRALMKLIYRVGAFPGQKGGV